MEDLIITNAKIITENQIIEGSLRIREGRIESFGDADEAGARCIDAGGLYLSPGFIDMHNHGRLGVNVADGKEASIEKIAAGQLAQGVTGFLAGPSTLPWEQYLEVIRVCALYCGGAHEDLSQCLGIYLEGVFFSEERRGAHMAQYLRHPEPEYVDAVLEAGCPHIKVFALAPELPGALDAVKKIRERGIVAAAAHTNADFTEAMKGINAGISLSTHTFNGMRALSHHDPSVIGAVLVDDRVSCEIIADGIHLDPAVLQLMLRVKGCDRIALVSDSVAFNGMPDGRYPYRNQHVTVGGGSIRLDDGRLAGSCLNLNRAVYNMVHLAGAGLCQAVRMASLVPARVLGMDDKKGSIAVGKDADLVLFDDELMVKKVFIKGKLCFSGSGI
jgi:N-acetylglucosamine-6-phosphate deacetylase